MSLVYGRHGPVKQVLHLVQESMASGKVHVKWLASPVNPADLNQIEGTYPLLPALPAVGGNEGVGRVMALHECCASLKVGDLVIPAKPGLGTWRQEGCYEVGEVVSIPDLPVEVACQLMVNPPTAYRLLHDFGNHKVIIQNGGNSAVGQLVMQMARLKGISCISVIRDRPDYNQVERQLLAMGSSMVIKAERLPLPETVQHIASVLSLPTLALNCVGGQSASDLARCLAPAGIMVTYGGMSRKPVTISTASLIFNDHVHRGFWLSRWYQTSLTADRDEMMKEIVTWIQQGKLTMPAIKKFALDDLTALDQPVHRSHKHVFWMSD